MRIAGLVMAVVVFAPAFLHAAEPAPAAKAGLRAVYIGGNPAQAVKDPASGEVRGTSADVAREIARRQGVNVTITPLASPTAVLDALRKGEADIGFVAPNAERLEGVLYTQPYMLVMQSFLVKQDSPIKSVRELDRPGLAVGASRGDSIALYLKTNFKQAKVVELEGPGGDVTTALTNGTVVAYGGNRQRLGATAKANPGLRLLEDSLYGVPQPIAVSSSQPALQRTLDTTIDELRTSGFLQRSATASGVDGLVIPAKEVDAAR